MDRRRNKAGSIDGICIALFFNPRVEEIGEPSLYGETERRRLSTQLGYLGVRRVREVLMKRETASKVNVPTALRTPISATWNRYRVFRMRELRLLRFVTHFDACELLI